MVPQGHVYVILYELLYMFHPYALQATDIVSRLGLQLRLATLW